MTSTLNSTQSHLDYQQIEDRIRQEQYSRSITINFQIQLQLYKRTVRIDRHLKMHVNYEAKKNGSRNDLKQREKKKFIIPSKRSSKNTLAEAMATRERRIRESKLGFRTLNAMASSFKASLREREAKREIAKWGSEMRITGTI